ncbi:MAG: class IV adenylate cyclase [Methanothrix sp.]|jgi:adenylate cyclase class 2|nr:class IV adenylate cyclase [Methanothrix sp.]
MIEVEVKARAPDGIAEKILSLGGELKAVENHHDLYFNSPLRDFRESDEALRIRIKEEGARLTYKGPKLDETTKSRLELTVKIDDARQMEEILINLGFVLSAEVRKRRRKYSYPGVILALDEVQGLGNFLEVEAEGQGEIDEQRQKVLLVLKQLGLGQSIRSSYLELLEEMRLVSAEDKGEQI